MLPFGFDAGDSKYRTMAADFLTGAKIGHRKKMLNLDKN